MSESKVRRRSHAAILEVASGCIYCGGRGDASQIDHMPPRLMFRISQRPKGLKFPSCAACNQGTSRLDVVAAYMARTFPGIANDVEAGEWERLMRKVERAAPGLMNEMHIPPERQSVGLAFHGIQDPNVRLLGANGPLVSAHMQAFAAKVGFALHYQFSRKIVPESGRVQVRWFTNEEMMNNKVPVSLYSSIGSPRIMEQGKITSKDMFEYGHSIYANRAEINLYFCRLRSAFEVAAFVVDDVVNLPFRDGELATFAPGDLQKAPYDRIKD
jgi:hypothetical protein